jgi:hypothetical protein
MKTYDLTSFSADVQTILTSDGLDGLPRIAEKLRQLLANPAFVAATFDANAPAKRTLHHDPQTDAYILAHVHAGGKAPGAPHSHGTSWAIYGNARGYTDMTIWRKTNATEDDHAELSVVERYRLDEGQARVYPSGTIHSTFQPEPAWVIRVTGTDLDVLPRFRYKPDRDKLVEAPAG